MNRSYEINKYCVISDNRVFIDGQILFSGEREEAFSGFVKKIYNHFKLDYPKFFKMDKLSKLGFIATELLLKNVNLSVAFQKDEIGIIIANSASSLDTDINHQKTINDRSDYFPSPAVFVYTLPNIVIGEICIKNKIMGETAFFVSEKFDINFIYNYIVGLFETEKIKCCITGWIELEGDQYESVLYLVKKTEDVKGNIIFEPENIKNIYLKKKIK